jgi:O-antigen/teichoic acid export membrane protein
MSTRDDSADQSVGLGTKSARGLVYFFAGSTVVKLVSFVGQVVLGYLLSQSDFGNYALAFTITAFIQVIEQAGVGDILVQRRNFRRWSIPGFWLALTLGTASCALVVLAGQIAARVSGDSQLFWLMAVLAPSSITNALSVVPRASLARQLNFRALALVNIGNLTLRPLLTVALATLFVATGQQQLGPFAFVVPVPITSALVAVLLWRWVRPPWKPTPHLRQWKYLIGDSARILTAELQRVFIDYSDYLLMWLFRRPVALIGIYSYGYSFSIQALQLFAFNLMNVLFPALAKLNDQPQVQYQGFLKAQRILAMLGVSSCLLQAAIAEPVTHLLLDPKWAPSVIVMQILCLGMATRMVAGSSYALLKSQGRFRAILWNRWVFVALQVVGLIAVLSQGGGIAAVAIVVALAASLIGPVTFYIAILPYGGGWTKVAEVLLPPVLSSGTAVGVAWLVSQWMARNGFGYLSQLAEIVAVAVLLGAIFARTFMRPVWDDLWARAWKLLPARLTA